MHLWMAWFPLSICETDPCCCMYRGLVPFPGSATFHFKNISQCLHPHYYYQKHHCRHHHEQHLGYFQFWAIIDHSAKNIPVLISWNIWDPQFLHGVYPGLESLELRLCPNRWLFCFYAYVQIYISISSLGEVPLF